MSSFQELKQHSLYYFYIALAPKGKSSRVFLSVLPSELMKTITMHGTRCHMPRLSAPEISDGCIRFSDTLLNHKTFLSSVASRRPVGSKRTHCITAHLPAKGWTSLFFSSEGSVSSVPASPPFRDELYCKAP